MAFSFLDDVSINTIVGPGSFIRGELTVAGFVRVDGDIDGNVRTDGRVIVGEDARIRGDVLAADITVGGVVLGDVVAEQGVTILSSGMVLGDVVTRKLHVEDNVVLNGTCFAVNDAERFASALADYNNRRAYRSSSLAGAHSFPHGTS